MKFGALALALTAISFTSCEKESADAIENDQAELVVDNVVGATGRALVTDQTTLDKIYGQLALDAGTVTKGDFHLPDGSIEERIYIGDDLVITEKQLDELVQLDQLDGQTRQFRTTNLVSSANQTIDILGYTGSGFALSAAGQTGLQWAVNNYNRLTGSNLRFNLTFGTNFNAADMVVYDNSANNSASGGVAGFPSNGLPNKFVQIYNLPTAGTTANNNLNEHVITHEIGHSIGFRHSDYYDRASCGQNSNEGTAGIGAIQLPGTPIRDLDSVMQACFSSGVDGEFSSADITALNAMY